jgi:hypothetical protein
MSSKIVTNLLREMIFAFMITVSFSIIVQVCDTPDWVPPGSPNEAVAATP